MKTINFCGANAASRYIPRSPTAVIRIFGSPLSKYGADKYPALKGDYAHKLECIFDDLEPEYSAYLEKLEKECMQKGYTLFNEAHAQEIFLFVDRVYNDVDSFLVHCYGGVSRSPAVATGLAEVLPGSFILEKGPELLRWMNRHVYQVMISTGKKLKLEKLLKNCVKQTEYEKLLEKM